MLLSREKSALLVIDVQEKLAPLVLNSKDMISNCSWLQKLAVRLSVPTLISEQYPKGLGETVSPLGAYKSPANFFSKVHFSCMSDEKFNDHLKMQEKTQIVLVGIEAHVCVLQTAMEMKNKGYDVFVAVNAVSSRYENDLQYGLKRMEQAGIHLVTCEMIFFEWIKKAGTREFKDLSKEFLK